MSKLFRILAFIGFMIILGTAGSCDVAVECGSYYSTWSLVKGIIVGMCFILPFLVRLYIVEEA